MIFENLLQTTICRSRPFPGRGDFLCMKVLCMSQCARGGFTEIVALVFGQVRINCRGFRKYDNAVGVGDIFPARHRQPDHFVSRVREYFCGPVEFV